MFERGIIMDEILSLIRNSPDPEKAVETATLILLEYLERLSEDREQPPACRRG